MDNTHQGKTSVKYRDLENAYFFVSMTSTFEAAAFICRESGKVYLKCDDYGDEFEVPEDVGDRKKFAQVPDKYDLDLGKRLVFRFVRESLPERYEDVSRIFRRRGAYARFKEFLFGHGKLDEWYAFENSSTEEALRQWAGLEGFEVEPVAEP